MRLPPILTFASVAFPSLALHHFFRNFFTGTPETFLMMCVIRRAASEMVCGVPNMDIRVCYMHGRTDEQSACEPPRDLQTSKYWRFKAAKNGASKATQQ